MAPDPFPVMVMPRPVAGNPDVVRGGRYDDLFDYRRGRLGTFNGLHGRRCWRRRTDGRRHRTAAGGIDHEVDDFLAHTAILEVQNLGGAQAVDGM